ncbi:hypothetical protein ThrDRAFT_03706 [Frankia casuarinae]|jgi:hypothetical protein|nr:hypothetical protein CcI6DRAFT_03850 [Frankia sp. CcI6]EYT90649.1 hypothetical protein ThrDRAFT_03706 [Frankia casuarinae]KDA41745.1 hypothetical protein BMG523Draft_03432 [Frankia sp. BMG5.23]KEZ35156.1 hypothetical protein CEDDRAFT_03492 [Frankia sp. CeD]KFB03206.1 hypothetical protein ALLO2DRAFT_04049 [Frankia sp. Allo2]
MTIKVIMDTIQPPTGDGKSEDQSREVERRRIVTTDGARTGQAGEPGQLKRGHGSPYLAS